MNTRASISHLPANAPILRFNAICARFILTQGRGLEMRLQRQTAALLRILGDNFRPCRNHAVAGVLQAALKRPPQPGIDKPEQQRHTARIGFNQPISFDRLTQRQTSRRYSHLSGIFTSAHHATSAPFSGGQWQGGHAPAGSLCRSVNPAICLPPNTFDSVKRPIDHKEKATS